MREYVEIGPHKIHKQDVVKSNGRDMLYVYPACGDPFSIAMHSPETIRRLILQWQGRGLGDEFSVGGDGEFI